MFKCSCCPSTYSQYLFSSLLLLSRAKWRSTKTTSSYCTATSGQLANWPNTGNGKVGFFFTVLPPPGDTECMLNAQQTCSLASCVFSHQFFILLSPSWNCFSFYPHSNLSHIFSPDKKDYSFWPYHSPQTSLKSEKQECFIWFESEDTCSSISGVQFRASSSRTETSRTRYFLKHTRFCSGQTMGILFCFFSL